MVFTTGILLHAGYGVSEGSDHLMHDGDMILSSSEAAFVILVAHITSYYHIDNEVPRQILISYLKKRETSPPTV
jgi:hypothetical protein